jgi:hypothetical protein
MHDMRFKNLKSQTWGDIRKWVYKYLYQVVDLQPAMETENKSNHSVETVFMA